MAPRVRKPHQVEGSDLGALKKRLCLWMEMRTGKTLTSLDSVKKADAWPLLIVCPKGLFPVWYSELKLDECDMDEVQIIEGSRATKNALLDNPKAVNIVNYDILANYNVLRRYPWASVIFDESIKLANMTAKVTQYCMDWAEYEGKEAEMVLMLSGSPASEGPFQLISQLFICTGSICGYDDAKKYLMSEWRYDEYQYKWKPRNKRVLEKLQQYSEQNAFIRKSADVGVDFRVLQRKMYVKPGRWVEKRLKRLWEAETYESADPDNPGTSYYTPLVRASHELQICAGLDPETKEIKDQGKFNAVRDYLVDLGEPALVLSNLRNHVIPHLAMVLEKAGLRVGVIVGGDAEGAREVLGAFQSGALDIVIGQISVVKMGLDFSRASTIVVFNNSYSHDDRVQALARCSNLQKTKPVEVLDFVYAETLDEEVVDILEQKESVSAEYMQYRYEQRRK